MLYVINASGTDFYKVGIANGPSGRLANLQIGCPIELTLVAVADWPDSEEFRIHRYLTARGHHVRGEWFRDCQEIQRLIESMESGKLEQWKQYQSSQAPSRIRPALRIANVG